MSHKTCVFSMVDVTKLPRAEFGPNDHREDASRFIITFIFVFPPKDSALRQSLVWSENNANCLLKSHKNVRRTIFIHRLIFSNNISQGSSHVVLSFELSDWTLFISSFIISGHFSQSIFAMKDEINSAVDLLPSFFLMKFNMQTIAWSSFVEKFEKFLISFSIKTYSHGH